MVSLGCPKNLVDSEVMLGTLQQGGYELTPDPADADVIVVNTCTFIEPARRESIDTILEMAGHKKSGRCRKLVVAGCMVQRNHDELRRAIPEIDALVGLNDIERIAEACALEAGARFEAGRERATYLYTHASPRLLTTPRHTAYVKISEGCDHTCSFCAIPSFRGLQRSRSVGSIVEEARALAGAGVVEINLIAQDTTDYGRDRSDGASPATLLKALDAVDGIRWIRVLYAYPNRITPEFVEALGSGRRVARYLDVPLQHADAGMLKAMRRGGSADTHLKLVETLRRGVPGIALRTTLIVGFPGETEADVEELSGFISDHAFDHLGVFTYSHEEGTSAYQLDDDVPARTKAARRARVMGLQKRLVQKRQRDRIGDRVRVLVDGPSSDHDLVLKARLSTQAPDIDASVYLTECDPSRFRAGDFVDVEIVGAQGYDLLARP